MMIVLWLWCVCVCVLCLCYGLCVLCFDEMCEGKVRRNAELNKNNVLALYEHVYVVIIYA